MTHQGTRTQGVSETRLEKHTFIDASADRGATDDDVSDLLSGLWETRSDRYSEARAEGTAGWDRVEMSYIGG